MFLAGIFNAKNNISVACLNKFKYDKIMSVLNVCFRLASFFPISSLLSLPDASDETSHYL